MSNAFDHFRLKNEMLFMNYLANAIGVCVVIFITYRPISEQFSDAFGSIYRMGWFFEPLFGALMLGVTLAYERPIRRWLDDRRSGQQSSGELTLSARRRLLNEPFFLIAVNLAVWIAAGGIYSAAILTSDSGRGLVYYAFFRSIQIGLITTVAAFFLLRSVLQKRMVPKLFPSGGLYAIPGTLRTRLGTRLAALLLGCNLVPFLAIITIMQSTSAAGDFSEELYAGLRSDIMVSSCAFMVIGILLTYQLSLNLRQPLLDIIRVLKAVRHGRFDQKVAVSSDDEIGYTGDVINEMTEGLKERDRMRHSLELAKEVQQNFMPSKAPQIEGLDIAGRSIYCDRTGGDYIDYLQTAEAGNCKVGIVIGDVSEHGIPSALLMASVRSSLRQRVMQPGSLGQIVSDVNRQLTADVEETGRFMTLFYGEIDSVRRTIRWVRAGHEPAILFDPQTNTFEELKGPGIALGLDQEWIYTENMREHLKKKQILLLCTDGVWEAHNRTGEMFGKEALLKVIRRNSNLSATEIVAAVISSVKQFQAGVKPEDDITLGVVKLKNGP